MRNRHQDRREWCKAKRCIGKSDFFYGLDKFRPDSRAGRTATKSELDGVEATGTTFMGYSNSIPLSRQMIEPETCSILS